MIKKIFYTTIIIMLFPLIANAQLSKGNWMVGGSGSYTHRTLKGDSGYKIIETSIEPSVGYFLKDKFVLGSFLGYNNNIWKDYSKSTVYGVGVFSRYYFLKPERTYNLFSQIFYEHAFFETNGGSIVKGSNYYYGAKIGQVIFFNSSIGLEFSIDYQKSVSKSSKTDTFNIGIGFQIHLEK